MPEHLSEAARAFLAAGTAATAAGLDPERAASIPAPTDLEGWALHVERTNRAIAERFSGLDLPVRAEETERGGVHIYVLTPDGHADRPDGPVFLDFHGGALVYGGGDLCRLMATAPTLGRGMTTWAVDYRMPPGDPYPAALDDAIGAYRVLLEERDPPDVFVGGASAGGNLAAALLVRAKEEGLPMPAGLVLLSPEVDLTESGDSFATLLGVDNVLGPLMSVNRLYAGGRDLADPHLSPLFADLEQFPPTLLQSGTRDLFLSNTVRMHRRLRAAGVDAELHVWEAMPHGGFGGAPEDAEVTAEVRRFLDRHRRH